MSYFPTFLFNPAEWSEWERWFDTHLADLISIFIFIFLLNVALRWFIRRVFHRLILRSERRRRGDDTEAAERRTDTILRVNQWLATGLMLFFGLVLVMDEFDKNVNALIAGAGVAGLAIGLAAQKLIQDYINGFIILAEDQYSVGDVVQLAGVSGTVEDVNPRRTVLRDLDGNVHTIPNGQIEVATNYTEGFSRINLDIGIAYEEDVDAAIAVINAVCDEFATAFRSDVLTPPAVLRVNALGDSSVDIKIIGDVRAGQQWALTGELRRLLKNEFDRQGIEIPYPHRTLVTKSASGDEDEDAGLGEATAEGE